MDFYFDNSDIQLIGLKFPNGLRNRIIESFARGLPVLSTNEGADGLYGLRKDDNMLIAYDALDFASKVTSLFVIINILISLSKK